MASYKPLIMRANRLLGASLVEHGLVSIEDLDIGNERLLDLMSTSSAEHGVSLLSILINEKQSVPESKILEYLVEEERLGIIDIRDMEVQEELASKIDRGECWATWTVPFDLVEDTHYLATAYYMSPAVRKYWEEKIAGKIVWYGAPFDSIVEYLESLEAEEGKAAAAAS